MNWVHIKSMYSVETSKKNVFIAHRRKEIRAHITSVGVQVIGYLT